MREIWKFQTTHGMYVCTSDTKLYKILYLLQRHIWQMKQIFSLVLFFFSVVCIKVQIAGMLSCNNVTVIYIRREDCRFCSLIWRNKIKTKFVAAIY